MPDNFYLVHTANEDGFKVTCRLKEYRKSLKISQEEIANYLGKSPSYISKIENGYEPSFKMAYLIVRALERICYQQTGRMPIINLESIFLIEPV
jgi:transcriptional regulator with XRE-family HTH domain